MKRVDCGSQLSEEACRSRGCCFNSTLTQPQCYEKGEKWYLENAIPPSLRTAKASCRQDKKRPSMLSACIVRAVWT